MVEQSQAEALAAAAAAGDSLICQAIINSGIALGTEEAVVEGTSQAAEEIDNVESDCPRADEGITEIQVKEEFVELAMETEVRIRHLLHCIMRVKTYLIRSEFFLSRTVSGDRSTPSHSSCLLL